MMFRLRNLKITDYRTLVCASYCHFSTSSSTLPKAPTNVKGRKKSSYDWLVRQFKDPYVHQAKLENYRARSAYKLLEMNDRFQIFRPGQYVLDLGCAPGSWTQVAVMKVNSLGLLPNKPIGKVVGVDKALVTDVEGATIFEQSDFMLQETRVQILKELAGARFDVVLSDMAPNCCGSKALDHQRVTLLCVEALKFSIDVLKTNDKGVFLCKLWEGEKRSSFVEGCRRFFRSVRTVKPEASRDDSSELYVLATGFHYVKGS